jgi:hypothetical protein
MAVFAVSARTLAIIFFLWHTRRESNGKYTLSEGSAWDHDESGDRSNHGESSFRLLFQMLQNHRQRTLIPHSFLFSVTILSENDRAE